MFYIGTQNDFVNPVLTVSQSRMCFDIIVLIRSIVQIASLF